MIEVNHFVVAMLVKNVDDLCWAIEATYEAHMSKILQALVASDDNLKSGTFSYCGKEVEQLPNFRYVLRASQHESTA